MSIRVGKTTRKRKGGQALVMITVALMAMTGMMGLAIDLGWSFFVKRSAQTAADGAAVAAVQEAYKLLTSNSRPMTPVNCGSDAYCQSTPLNCSSITSGQANLYSACLFAARNGFTDGGQSGRQRVTVQSNVKSGGLPPTVPGVTDVSYWVTVRTTQTVPQLFSGLLGNTNGIVSSISTAGIASMVEPNSFIGLNRERDCTRDSSSGTAENCGVNVNLPGPGVGCDAGTSTSRNASMCAPGGALLSSTCHGGGSGYSGSDCQNPGSNSRTYDAYARIYAPGSQIRGAGHWSNGSTFNPAPALNQGGPQFLDPTRGQGQPPLANSSAVKGCAVTHSSNATPTLGSGNGTTYLGPYQYYSVDSRGRPDGLKIRVQGDVVFTSNLPSGNDGCPTGSPTSSGASQSGNSFPMYLFWGGLDVNSTNGSGSANVTFNAGQYVMAGVRSNTSSSCSSSCVFSATGAEMTGNSSTGTMFVFTDGSYNGALATQRNIPGSSGYDLASLKQGYVSITGGDVDLSGVNNDNLPSGSNLGSYGGLLFWQDRRNSTVTNDATTGNTTSTSEPPSNYNASDYSPKIILGSSSTSGEHDQEGHDNDHNNNDAALRLSGVIYQPRGAWLQVQPGTHLGHEHHSDGHGTTHMRLQLITGAVIAGETTNHHFHGDDHDDDHDANASLVLEPVANPLIRYTVTMMQ
ncbi:MAG: pilus assembly protein TadG-related protein [Bryobacteraceae bacterium]